MLGYAAFLRVLHYYTQPWYYITLVAFAGCALDVLFGSWPDAAKFRIPFVLRSIRVADRALPSLPGCRLRLGAKCGHAIRIST